MILVLMRCSSAGGTKIMVPKEDAMMRVYHENVVPGANTHAITDSWEGWTRGMNERNRGLLKDKLSGKRQYGDNPIRFTWKKVKEFTV